MNPARLELSITPRRRWAGRVISGAAVLFLLMDSGMKVARTAPALEGTVRLGYPEGSIVPIGLVQLACVLVYLVPRWSIFGGVLLTGYLGGAVATNVRVGSPLFTHILFPVYIAVLLWGGLYLRDPRVRLLLESRSD